MQNHNSFGDFSGRITCERQTTLKRRWLKAGITAARWGMAAPLACQSRWPIYKLWSRDKSALNKVCELGTLSQATFQTHYKSLWNQNTFHNNCPNRWGYMTTNFELMFLSPSHFVSLLVWDFDNSTPPPPPSLRLPSRIRIFLSITGAIGSVGQQGALPAGGFMLPGDSETLKAPGSSVGEADFNGGNFYVI